MATSNEFVNFIHDQLDAKCDISHKKMFVLPLPKPKKPRTNKA